LVEVSPTLKAQMTLEYKKQLILLHMAVPSKGTQQLGHLHIRVFHLAMTRGDQYSVNEAASSARGRLEIITNKQKG
jgi:hypothetical protein